MSQDVNYNYNQLRDEPSKVLRCGCVPLNDSEVVPVPRGGYSQELNLNSAYRCVKGKKSVKFTIEAVQIKRRLSEVSVDVRCIVIRQVKIDILEKS